MAVNEVSLDSVGHLGGSDNNTVALVLLSGRLFGAAIPAKVRYSLLWGDISNFVAADSIDFFSVLLRTAGRGSVAIYTYFGRARFLRVLIW